MGKLGCDISLVFGGGRAQSHFAAYLGSVKSELGFICNGQGMPAPNASPLLFILFIPSYGRGVSSTFSFFWPESLGQADVRMAHRVTAKQFPDVQFYR